MLLSQKPQGTGKKRLLKRTPQSSFDAAAGKRTHAYEPELSKIIAERHRPSKEGRHPVARQVGRLLGLKIKHNLAEEIC